MTADVPRVLVDTCAREHGVLIGRAVKVRESTTWGDLPIELEVVRLQGRKLEPNADWLREQVKELAAIAAAALARRLELCTSSELMFEGPHKVGFAGVRGDLWQGVSLAHVAPPLERSTWMGALTLDQAFSGDHQQRFCERILSFARDGVPQGLLDMLKLDELQRGNLDRLGEYLTLCEAVGPRRYRDAFHLWTALCNGFDYFLTTDETFVRVVREQCADIDLHVAAVLPSELVDALHLPPASLPISEGEIIPFPLF